jgi:ADP-ribosylation factor-binding protein GGA
VQLKILEAIEEWRQTICMNSRYKDDLGFIRDMHRLLSYKGYTFPEVRREHAAVLNPSDVCPMSSLAAEPAANFV